MLVQVAFSLLLIFVSHLYYKYIYLLQKQRNYYKRVFEAAGYKVLVRPFSLFGSSFIKTLDEGLKNHKDALYLAKTELPNYDVEIATIADRVSLSIMNPDLLKELFTTNEAAYIKYEPILAGLKRVVGNGIVFSEGAAWKKNRKIISNSFHFEFLYSLIPKVVSSVQQMLSRYQQENAAKDDGERSMWILQVFQEIFSNIVVKFFFGGSLEHKRIEGEVASTYLGKLIIDTTKQSFQTVSILLGPKFLELGLRHKDRDINRRTKQFRQFAISLVSEKVQELKKSGFKAGVNKASNLIEELFLANSLNQKDTSEDTYSYNQLVEQFCTFFVAGTDTTSHLTTMMLVYLNKHPHVLEKLRQETQGIIKNDADYNNDNLKKMEYMMAVINEAQRMYGPATSIFLREATTSHTLCGVPIQKGTLINPGLLSNGYCSKYYKNPEVFRPERWLQENKTMPHPYAFVPFSAGKRNCIGQYLAIIQAKILISKFITRYDFKMPEEVHMDFGFIYTPLKFDTTVKMRTQANSSAS